MDLIGLVKDKGFYTFLAIVVAAVIGLANPGFVDWVLIIGGLAGVAGVLYKIFVEHK
jgi:uncharacterized membrane protein